MLYTTLLSTLLGAGAVLGAPSVLLNPRVTLDPAATAEAQQRDDTATRAFSAVEIKNSAGLCMTVDLNSGDFRENLQNIDLAACNGSDVQQWDVITSGKHNNVPGFALFVSTKTSGCLNFDPRRAAGNQVIMFSCGGRADGSGATTDSQLFPFSGATTLPLSPKATKNATCLVNNNGLLDQTSCDSSADQLFTIGSGSGSSSGSGSNNSGTGSAASSSSAIASASASSAAASSSADASCPAPPPAQTVTQTVTVTAAAEIATSAAPSCDTAVTEKTIVVTVTTTVGGSETEIAVTTSAAAAATTTTTTAAGASKTTGAAISLTSVTLNPSAVAEAQVRDNTATRAFSSALIKSSTGQCLTIDPNSGDFRENLIPVTIQDCNGSDGQKFDVITKGVHNNVAGTALIVSSLTQGCLNFDPRRAAGNQIILFSCGGRADGSGQVTNSQLFTFTGGSGPLALIPTNQANTCLVNENDFLNPTTCDTTDPTGNELFTIVA